MWASARNIVARTGKTFEEAVETMARLNAGGRLVQPAEIAAVAAGLVRDDSTNGDGDRDRRTDGGTGPPGPRPRGRHDMRIRITEPINPPALMKPAGFSHGDDARRPAPLPLRPGRQGRGRSGRGQGRRGGAVPQGLRGHREVVAAAGGRLSDVVKLTIYVLDAGVQARLRASLGVVYREFSAATTPR